MASTRLQNPASGATVSDERKKMTFSFWVKRSKVGSGDHVLIEGRNSGSYFAHIMFNSDDYLRVRQYAGGSSDFYYQTNRKFRDTNAWYHIVVGIDTNNSTVNDRIKIWVNGVRETSFSTSTQPNTNLSTYFGMTNGGDGYPMYIGDDGAGGKYFDGVMADVYGVGNQQYDASVFGETDSTTGEWKPITNPTISYGTGVAGNFHLKFDDTSNFGKNSATGFTSNHWSVSSGTLTKTEDCPSNVFCTWNRLNKGSNIDMNYGNTNIYGNTTNNGNTWGTLSFPPSGKYYWETKVIAYNSGSSGYPQIGIIRDNTISQGTMNGGNDGYVSSSKDCYYPVGGTTIYSKNGNITISATSLNDVIMCAMDSTAGNMKFWMGVNGTWWNSGDPANGTNAIWTETGDYQSVPFIAGYNGSRGDTNFGNGYFGTTAVSSAGTNASGNGIFEYDVPTGYTALSTKGLNE